MDFSINSLQGTRCRLQRLSDLKFFAGWIRSISSEEMSVELPRASVIQIGDQFNLEASLNMATVGLPCVLESSEGNLLQLAITGAPRLASNVQEARYRADGITVTIQGLPVQLDAETADISHNGIGVWTAEPLPRFALLRLVVRSPAIMVECGGMVRYSRPDPDYKGAFRSGIQVDFEDRLSQSMWIRLVQSAQGGYKAA